MNSLRLGSQINRDYEKFMFICSSELLYTCETNDLKDL